jgi:hypothetical protein
MGALFSEIKHLIQHLHPFRFGIGFLQKLAKGVTFDVFSEVLYSLIAEVPQSRDRLHKVPRESMFVNLPWNFRQIVRREFLVLRLEVPLHSIQIRRGAIDARE